MQARLTEGQAKLLETQAEDIATGTRLKNALLLSQTHALGAQAGLTMMQQDALQQTMQRNQMDLDFQRLTFDERVALISAQLKRAGQEIETGKIEQYLKSLQVNPAQAESRFWENAGTGQTGLKAILELLRLLK